MAQHTPGQWQQHPMRSRLIVVEYSEHDTGAHYREIAEARTDEDARLITAAPELLAACKAVLAWADAECMPQGGKNDGPWELLEAAIAKAEAR